MASESAWQVEGIPPELRDRIEREARERGLTPGEYLTQQIGGQLGAGAAALSGNAVPAPMMHFSGRSQPLRKN